jgi:hypothetical protein
VGTDHDTASFAVNAIRRWWRAMGKKRHPKAKRLMISADGGGSNGYRVRLWKIELQRLADELRLPITSLSLSPISTSSLDLRLLRVCGGGRSLRVAAPRLRRHVGLFSSSSMSAPPVARTIAPASIWWKRGRTP